jgi:hypothetical protein
VFDLYKEDAKRPQTANLVYKPRFWLEMQSHGPSDPIMPPSRSPVSWTALVDCAQQLCNHQPPVVGRSPNLAASLDFGELSRAATRDFARFAGNTRRRRRG